MQTVEEAQDLNRRLHRRVQKMEAPYDAKVASAQQDTARALRQVEASQKEQVRLLQWVRSTQEDRDRDIAGLQYLFWLGVGFFWWAVAATGAAVYFYFH